MNRHHPRFLLWIAGFVIFVFCSCSHSDRIVGGTSETTNGITAMVHDQNGNVVSYAQVRIRPQNYLADTSNQNVTYDSLAIIDTSTNASGRITVKHLAVGDYTVEFRDEEGMGSMARVHVEKDTLVDLGITVVQPMGSIDGVIDLVTLKSATKIHVLVRGVESATIADPITGKFSVRNLPRGKYALRFIPVQPSYGPREIENLAVLSGNASNIGTVHLNPYDTWRFSQKIVLNTTVSGANIPGNLYGFPVLIRLYAGNFDFSKAQVDGADIRFATSDSIPLAYEIERWDSSLQQAAIWVKMDTVRGNDLAQGLTMFWGNSAVLTNSNDGSSVFDSSNGFLGVWHMQGKAGQKVVDASANKNNATNYGTVDTLGIIGSAKKFTAKDSLVIPGLMNSLQAISLSAWMNVDTVNAGTYGGDVVSVGDAVMIRADEKSFGIMGGFHSNDTNYNVVASGQNLAKTGWHFVVFTCDAKNHVQTLYIDGAVSKKQNFANSIAYSGVGKNTVIGAHGNGKKNLNYSGEIDEVRISSKVTSADWILLSFRNQGLNNTFVEFFGEPIEKTGLP
jgi:hypothetical protein